MRASLLLIALAACGTKSMDPPNEPPGSPSSAPSFPVDRRAPAAATTPPVASTPPPVITPDTFAPGEVDVVSIAHTGEQKRPISPLIYGMNTPMTGTLPASVLAGATFLRRGGDRCNAYNWETNLSNGSRIVGFANDMFLAEGLASPNAPGELDRALIASNIAGGRGTMVPFVLNDYVAATPASNIPYTLPGWNIGQWFRRVEIVKPTPFALVPDANDGVVYTDEHVDFLRRQFPGDIYAPGKAQVMVGTDNEPDLYVSNFPMLQRGSGEALYEDGAHVGNRITAVELTQRVIKFATRVKQMSPQAMVVGPDHFHYDGWTNFHGENKVKYSDEGRWYMEDFLEDLRAAGDKLGKRLLDTWDFHWYPQRVFGGTFTWSLDHAVRPLTEPEIEAILQGPRSYWDHDWDEHSWITDDHLHGPAYILERLFNRIDSSYPGTGLGVTEYFPGGCAHVSSALATADTLGVFGRMGVRIAAMWPHTCDLGYALGGFELLRNANGNGLHFGETSVRLEHPEKVESSAFAAFGDDGRVTALIINKTKASRSFGLRVFHTAKLQSVDVFRVDASHVRPALVEHATLTKTNAWRYDAPPMSAALVVLSAN
jgi:hypothetical protein